jgi:DNA-binding NarL/FixJ family response regulator
VTWTPHNQRSQVQILSRYKTEARSRKGRASCVSDIWGVLGELISAAVSHTPPTEIVHAVPLVAAGEAMLSPSVTRTLLAHLGDSAVNDRRAAATARLASLSDREREVAVAVAAGSSNADIAAQLYLSEATVKAYVLRLLAKLDAANRVRIAILVHDAGLA